MGFRRRDGDLSLQALRNVESDKRGDEANVKMPCRQGVKRIETNARTKKMQMQRKETWKKSNVPLSLL